MNTRHKEFVDAVLEEFGPVENFEPAAYYNEDGDCIEFLISNEPYFARVIDGWVSVYYSEKTGDIVGGLIKGVFHNLLRRFPGVKIEFEGSTVKVVCLLRAPAYQQGDQVKLKSYKDLIERIEAYEFSAELQPA